MVAWAVQSQRVSLCGLLGIKSATQTEAVTGRAALSARQSPSCPLGGHGCMCGRPHLPPNVQINDLAQVCRADIWSVPREKHYLLKFPPSRKQGMTRGGKKSHIRARPSSVGAGTQTRFMLGDLKTLAGDGFRHNLCELATAVKLGRGIQALQILSMLCQGVSNPSTGFQESAGLVMGLPSGSGRGFEAKCVYVCACV